VSVGHGDLHVLHNLSLDVLHGLLGHIVDGKLCLDGLSMEVDVARQSDLKVEPSWRKSEALADQGLGLTVAGARTGVLDLSDSKADGVPLVRTFLLAVSNVQLEIVNHTKRLSLFQRNTRHGNHLIAISIFFVKIIEANNKLDQLMRSSFERFDRIKNRSLTNEQNR